MPNYGNKMTVAAADEPPYLTVGTDVSAKYKGAFCEAKIIDVNKHVKLRVLFDGHPGSYMIDDTELKQGSPLEIGSKIEARHPEKKQQIYINATIQKILDQSRYTVVFDDGDQCILRRNSICLKSGKHFAESETLDQLPLTNPEHFGNPVKVGQASLEQNNHINSTNHNLQQVANHSTTKLNNNITNNNNASSASNSGNGKNGYADFNNQSSSTTDKNGKGQNNVKLETEKLSKGQSTSSPSNNNSNPTTGSSAIGPPGRRGGGKGRRRRESTSTSSKQTTELDDEPGDDSQDSADLDPGESDVDFSSIEIGVKLMVQYGKGKVQNVYEAKVNKIETNSSGKIRYFVHYTGWNNRYDEWITKSRILSIVVDKDYPAKDTRSKQAEPNSIAANANQISSSEVTVKSEPVVSKDKEKDKDVKQPAKAARRSRHLDAASSPVAAPNPISSAEPSASNLTSTVTANNKQGVPATPSREKDRERDKQQDKDKEKDEEKDIPSKTRRTRLPVDNSTSASSIESSASTSEPKVSIKQEGDIKEKEKSRDREKGGKDKEKEKSKEKESVASPATRPGRPRLTDAISTAQSAEKAQVTLSKEKEKEPPTKTRRSRYVDAASSANAALTNSSASSTASSTPPRSDAIQNDRDKTRDLEKEAHHSAKDGRSNKQAESASQANQKPNNSSTLMKDRDPDKDLSTPAKTRASKQTDTRHTSSSSSLASTTVSSSSLSSVSTATTTTSSIATTASSTSTAPSTTTNSDTILLSTPSISSKDREKEREQERERDRDKEPPTKIRRSRQSAQEAAGNVSSKDTSATTSTNNATTTTITTSTASSTSSTASSTSSSSYSLALPNPALSALVSLSEREREKFDDALIIDEPDCDKRISILQDKIMTIRHTYMALKAELADLDRRRKRPRMERSSSDHINNFNSSVTCRN